MYLEPDPQPEPARDLARIVASQHGVFSIEDARGAGFTQHQIERRIGRSWSPLYEGVYRLAGAPVTWRSGLLAAALAAGAGSAISHRSGAALYGLPGGRRELIELSCLRWKRTTHPGLIVHESTRLDPRDVQQHEAIPVTRPERVVIELASVFPSANYLELVVQAARRKRLITYPSMCEMFDRHARRGLKGVRALRETLARWDPESRPTDSEMETLLLQALREHGLPEPVIQYEVYTASGQFVGRPDAAYPSARIAIEYDSKQEHSDEFQLASDARRRNALQASGFAVLSARHADLRAGGSVLCGQIVEIMRRAAEPA